MDITDPKTFKMAYTIVAAFIALCAIVMALLRQYDIGVVLIVIGCIIIFIGSMVFSQMMKAQKMKELEKL
jgi:hypothetical protein